MVPQTRRRDRFSGQTEAAGYFPPHHYCVEIIERVTKETYTAFMASEFAERIRTAVLTVPSGKVATYGQIAALAGNHRGARTVSMILRSSSKAYRLPWHRIIGGKGTISLPRGGGYEEQYSRLQAEGVEFLSSGKIDLSRFQWQPGTVEL